MRMTTTTAIVLQLLARAPEEGLYGLTVAKHSGLKTGSVYPILVRLVGAGWCEGYWEDADTAITEKRARRRYYRLTELGRTRAAEPIYSGIQTFRLVIDDVHDDTTNR